jgi:hypothetical protein
MTVQDLKNILESLSTTKMPVQVTQENRWNYGVCKRFNINVVIKNKLCYMEERDYSATTSSSEPPPELIDEVCREIVRNVLIWGLWENYKYAVDRDNKLFNLNKEY